MERAGSSEKTGTKGSWLVIKGPFGRFIIRSEVKKAELSMELSKGGAIPVLDAFEFISEVQVQQGQHPQDPSRMVQHIAKVNLVTRVDACCYDLPMQFSLHGCMVYWLDDLNSSDAIAYKELIQNAVHTAKGWASHRAEKTAGVQLASTMPTGVPIPGGRA